MNLERTDSGRDIHKELEIFRSELEQDFLKESQALEKKRQERLERLEEITRQTLETVDGEWQGLREKVLQDASRQRERAFSRLDEMLRGLDRDGLVREITQNALHRLLGEEERKDAGS